MSSIPPAQRLENAINELKQLTGAAKIDAAKALAGMLVSGFVNVPTQPTNEEFEGMTDAQIDTYADGVAELLPTLTPIEPSEPDGL